MIGTTPSHNNYFPCTNISFPSTHSDCNYYCLQLVFAPAVLLIKHLSNECIVLSVLSINFHPSVLMYYLIFLMPVCMKKKIDKKALNKFLSSPLNILHLILRPRLFDIFPVIVCWADYQIHVRF